MDSQWTNEEAILTVTEEGILVVESVTLGIVEYSLASNPLLVFQKSVIAGRLGALCIDRTGPTEGTVVPVSETDALAIIAACEAYFDPEDPMPDQEDFYV